MFLKDGTFNPASSWNFIGHPTQGIRDIKHDIYSKETLFLAYVKGWHSVFYIKLKVDIVLSIAKCEEC